MCLAHIVVAAVNFIEYFGVNVCVCVCGVFTCFYFLVELHFAPLSNIINEAAYWYVASKAVSKKKHENK